MNKSFPILYKKSSKGKIYEWSIIVTKGMNSINFNTKTTSINNCFLIQISHGYIDGKKQIEEIEVSSGKNIGKANETTPFEQACSEAESKWKKQKDKGYTEDPSGIAKMNVILPMLAEKYKERKKYMRYPCFHQPKLNGCRCISYDKDGKRVYQSRKGILWDTLSHLDEDLKKLGIDKTDGEIYIHGIFLQDIVAMIKKERTDTEEFGYATKDLQYYIYDIVDENLTFKERNTKLLDAFKKHGKVDYASGKCYLGNLVYVPTILVDNEEKMYSLHKSFIADEYEGSMLRNADSLYQINKRTNDLQKVKEILDGEFKIVGGYMVESGREKGSCVFKCETEDGKTFDVRPKGSLKQKRDYWNNLNKLIGKMLTVEFQEWTKEGAPFHCRGIVIRDYE